MTATSDNEKYESGSEWRRWDPHIHAPGTLLNDEFHGDWGGFLEKIQETSRAEVLGITDYFCIETYREVRRRKDKGEFETVKMIFPNVEMRLNVPTYQDRGVNIHLLFSPDDPNHESEILRLLGQLYWDIDLKNYPCTLEGLAALGRAYNPKQQNEDAAIREGANQFKVNLRDLKRLFRDEKWMQKNCLVAISVKSGDGTSGLRGDSSFVTARTEIERFADIIFSSNPSQREFWLGLKPGCDRKFIEHNYRFLKPCLHGSDAHKSERVTPDLERYCWIKGDPTFETLRQAVLEPELRVWLGESYPSHKVPSDSIALVRTQDTPWLTNNEIQLNSGLVAIIGARGSGKTALADIIARATRALDWSDKDAFLRRASTPKDYIGKGAVFLYWLDGEEGSAWLRRQEGEPERSPDPSQVRYLSQHFVEQLCSAEGLATQLRKEMERVIFDKTDPTEKLETDSFEELADVSLTAVRARRQDLRDSISRASQLIVQEDALISRLPNMRKEAEELKKNVDKDNRALAALLPKGMEDRARRLVAVQKASTEVEGLVEGLNKCRRIIGDLEREAAHVRDFIEPNRLREMREDFREAALTDEQWDQFRMVFVGDVDSVLGQAKQQADRAINLATNGEPTVELDRTRPLNEWPLNALRAARETLTKEVGIDKGKRQKYEQLEKAVADQNSSLRRLEGEIKNAEGASERRKALIDSRRVTYAQIFDTFVEEQDVLERLYAPLRRELADATGALSKLRFSVNRYVDLLGWERNGEALFDLRKDSAFQGHGGLRTKAEKFLLQSWLRGSAEDVTTAMDDFRKEYWKEMQKAIPNDVADRATWYQKVAEWLYGTSHIDIDYGIEYEGTAIEQLSPGTRGIVLLLLYLAVDVSDRRPLIIDQPEENLDPNSVFAELVPHFRNAKGRRQIIIVTHNANLVVNTDADQVIVAEASRTYEQGLPTINYRCGSIENDAIRRCVCETLEGGERAFLERERRYRLRWEDKSEFGGELLKNKTS